MAGSIGSAAVKGLFTAATNAARQAKPLAQAALSNGGAAHDKMLSSLSSGFAAQMKNPSAARHLFSTQLKDASRKFSSGSLSDMLLSPMKSSARQLQTFVKNGLPEVYDKSGTFRAIFNNAYRDDVRHHGNPPQWQANPHSKHTHGAQANVPHKELGLQLLNDILEGASPTYQTEQGERPVSPMRAFVSAAVEGLTSLSHKDEPEHPRGASTELSNIVMHEVDAHEAPCIQSSQLNDEAPAIIAPVPQRPPASNAAATFRQNMQALDQRGGITAPSGPVIATNTAPLAHPQPTRPLSADNATAFMRNTQAMAEQPARPHTTGGMQATYQPGRDGQQDLLAQGEQAKQAQRAMQRQAIEQQLKAPPPVPRKVALDAPDVPPKVGNNAALQRRPAMRRRPASSDGTAPARPAPLNRTQSAPQRIQSDSFNAEYSSRMANNDAARRQSAAQPSRPQAASQPAVPPRPAPLNRTQSAPERIQSDSFNDEYSSRMAFNEAARRQVGSDSADS